MKIDENLYPNLALAAKFLPPILAELENMMTAFVKKYQNDEELLRQFAAFLESRQSKQSLPAAKAEPVVAPAPTSSSLVDWYHIVDPVTVFKVRLLEAAARKREGLDAFYSEVVASSNFKPGVSVNRKCGGMLAQLKSRARPAFVTAVLACVPRKQHGQVLQQLSQLYVQAGTTVTDAELRAEARGK